MEFQNNKHLSDQERIALILSDKWIGYTIAEKYLNKMEETLMYPQVIRMPNLLLAGQTNNGKTALLNRFFQRHKPIIRSEDSNLIAPVIYVQAPPKPSEQDFYNNILNKLNVPHRIGERSDKKLAQIMTVLPKIHTRILIIDEIHHVLAGSSLKHRAFLNVLKYISNELRISLIAAGIKDAFLAIQSDPQMSNRFEPIILPHWEMNEEYYVLLLSFESLMPLKNEVGLRDPEIAGKILTMSEGTIGEISTIIKLASIHAIKSGDETIKKSTLQKIDYISPSERKMKINKLA